MKNLKKGLMMFGRTPKEEFIDLKPVADRLLDDMAMFGPNSEEYTKMLDHLQKVVALKSRDKKSIDPNTVIVVLGNIFGILTIVIYEQKHVFASKAIGFVLKSREP